MMVSNGSFDGGRGPWRVRLGCAWLAPLVLTLLTSSAAMAEPSPSEKETARRLMQEGRAERDRKDLDGALKSFLGADAIMAVPTTGVEVARTEVALGLLVEARDKLLSVIRIPVASPEPQAFDDARKLAQSVNDELLPRIPTVRMTLRGLPGPPETRTPTVTLDGHRVPVVALNAAFAVNPGHHVVVVGFKGGESKHVSFNIVEREAKDVEIDVPPPPPLAPILAQESLVSGPAGTERRSPSLAPVLKRPPPTLAYVGFVAGGVGLVAGAIAGAITIADTSSAKANGCAGDRCPPSTFGDINTARVAATVADVAFAVAVVGAGVGVVGVFVRGGPQPVAPSAKSLTVGPYVGLGAIGVAGAF